MMKTTPNDQAVKDLNFAEFKRIGLLSKKIMHQSVIGVALSKCSTKGGNHSSQQGIKPFIDAEQSAYRDHIRCNFIVQAIKAKKRT
jgi:hypothetical protein